MKIRFAFHRGKDSFVGKSIVGWTWILGCFYNWKVLKYNYSHVEVWILDENGNFEGTSTLLKRGKFEIDWLTTKTIYLGQCFSSTTRGDANGVRFAPAADVLHNPERWDYIEVEVDPERLEVAVEEAKKLIGGGYDYGYIISFLQPFIVQKENDWACSEICAWFGKLCGLFTKIFKRISPRRLAYLLAKVHGEPKELC